MEKIGYGFMAKSTALVGDNAPKSSRRRVKRDGVNGKNLPVQSV
jgi:hypothetical protein